MQLNKIYRYYGIPTAQAYAHMKEKFTEAFTGFDGVSFETVEATEETADDGTVTTTPEQYIIYLDNDKSTWLKLYVNSSGYPAMAVYFKNGASSVFSSAGSSTQSNSYRRYNIARTAYGVGFSGIGCISSNTSILDDKYLTNFFVVGSPNVLIRTEAISNTSTETYLDYWYSALHEKPEIFECASAICSGAVTRTKIVNASSMVQDIDCEHLYRINFTDGKVGKIKVGEKYVILGTRYALEYDPNDDSKEV